MMPANVIEAKQAEDLLIGVLASLARDGNNTLRINDRSFHAAFGQALQVFRRAGGQLGELAETFYRDVVSKTYEKLDDSLIAAEHYGMVRIFNPTFELLEISITPRVATEILNEWNGAERAAIERAATAFRRRASRR